MERTFVLGADQHENGMHLGGLLRKAKAFLTAGEQDIEMFVAVDDDMRDGEKRAQHRGAFFFSLDEEAAEGVGIDIEMFGHSVSSLTKKFFMINGVFYVKDRALFDKMVEAIFENLVAFMYDILEFGFQVMRCDFAGGHVPIA